MRGAWDHYTYITSTCRCWSIKLAVRLTDNLRASDQRELVVIAHVLNHRARLHRGSGATTVPSILDLGGRLALRRYLHCSHKHLYCTMPAIPPHALPSHTSVHHSVQLNNTIDRFTLYIYQGNLWGLPQPQWGT